MSKLLVDYDRFILLMRSMGIEPINTLRFGEDVRKEILIEKQSAPTSHSESA